MILSCLLSVLVKRKASLGFAPNGAWVDARGTVNPANGAWVSHAPSLPPFPDQAASHLAYTSSLLILSSVLQWCAATMHSQWLPSESCSLDRPWSRPLKVRAVTYLRGYCQTYLRLYSTLCMLIPLCGLYPWLQSVLVRRSEVYLPVSTNAAWLQPDAAHTNMLALIQIVFSSHSRLSL